MLRKSNRLAWTLIMALGAAATSQAQQSALRGGRSAGPAGTPRESAGAGASANSPTGGSSNLVDRLKAIRGAVVSDYSDDTSAERGTESAVPSERVSDRSEGPELPSVLVRRGAAASPAPIVESPASRSNVPDNAPSVPAVSVAVEDTSQDGQRTARRPQRDAGAARSTIPFSAPPAYSSAPSAPAASSSVAAWKSEGPSLQIELDGPSSVRVGKEAIYRVRLINPGSSDAQRVVVSVSLPAGVEVISARTRLGTAEEAADAGGRRVLWEADRVAARSQNELTLTLRPTENRPFDLLVDWAFRPAPVQGRVEVQQPLLATAIEGPVEMRYGDKAVFKVRVSNPGTGAADNVSLSLGATGTSNQSKLIGTLAAGESRVVDVEFSAQQAGAMRIAATAQGDGELVADAEHEVRVRRAELAVKITGPPLLFAGTTAQYQIRVTNEGDASAPDVVLLLELPPGAQNAVGLDKKPITAAQPRWRLGDLAPGAEQVYTLQCDLTGTGPNQLSARVQGQDQTAATDAIKTVVEAIADLKLFVNDPQGPVPVGKEVVYEILITNRGSKEATNIEVVAQFSEGIEPTGAVGHGGQVLPGQVVFEPIRSLAAGDQISLKVTARAHQSGNLRFRAELTCADLDTTLASEENTRFFQAVKGASDTSTETRAAVQPTPARR